MLDLALAAPPESLRITVLAQAQGVPEAHRSLHAKLTLEGPQGRGGEERPIAPRLSGEAILEEHAHDCHHRQAAVGNLCIQAPCALGWVLHTLASDAEPALAVVARLLRLHRLVHHK